MLYAEPVQDVLAKRTAFLRKWRVRCSAVADSLPEAGEQLFTFLRLPPSQWRSIRTTNAIERLHEEFKRRIKTQCLLPCAETACLLFWALVASGQIKLRKVDGWHSLHVPPAKQRLDAAAWTRSLQRRDQRHRLSPPTSRHDRCRMKNSLSLCHDSGPDARL